MRISSWVLCFTVLCVFALGADHASAQGESTQNSPDETRREQDQKADDGSTDTAPPSAARSQGAQPPAESAADEGPDATTSSSLTFAKWGGAYGQALDAAIVKPFAAQSGINVRVVDIHAPRGKELSVIEGSDPPPDLIELSGAALDKACQTGLVQKIDANGLAPGAGGESVADDFSKGGIHACGVGTFAWASLIVSSPTPKKGKRATSMKHVFGPKAYPGKRAFIKSPRYVFEMALLSDGVDPDNIYQVLESDEGLERTLKVLDGLQPNLIWANNAVQAMALLKSGKVRFAQTFTGRAFYEKMNGVEFYPLLDGQVYAINYLAIPAKASRRDAAQSMLKFATSPKVLAAASSLHPYGPLRRSALDLVSRHALINVPLDAFLTTTPKTLSRAVAVDEVWWAENQTRMAEAFNEWLNAKAAAAAPKAEKKPATP